MRPGVGLRIWVYDKVPADADAVDRRTTLWDPLGLGKSNISGFKQHLLCTLSKNGSEEGPWLPWLLCLLTLSQCKAFRNWRTLVHFLGFPRCCWEIQLFGFPFISDNFLLWFYLYPWKLLPPWSPLVWNFTMMCSWGCSFCSQRLALAGCFHSENVCPSGKSYWTISLMFLFPSFLLFILSGTPICQLIVSNGLILLTVFPFLSIPSIYSHFIF